MLEISRVHIDSQLTLRMQIREKCKTAARNLHLIRRIRDYLTIESCHQLVLALVIAHIDYGNAIYFGLPQVTLIPLYRIQAMAAKLENVNLTVLQRL